MPDADLPRLGRGFYWQDLKVGDRFQTFRRTITEADLVNFICATGMLEDLFVDATREGGTVDGRIVPAVLSYSFIEGMLLQTMIRGTAHALLESSMKAVAPVRVGDTISGVVEVTSLRPTSSGNRAIVDSEIVISNQHGETVLIYSARRMLSGRPEA